jgi:hypothetical protein
MRMRNARKRLPTGSVCGGGPLVDEQVRVRATGPAPRAVVEPARDPVADRLRERDDAAVEVQPTVADVGSCGRSADIPRTYAPRLRVPTGAVIRLAVENDSFAAVVAEGPDYAATIMALSHETTIEVAADTAIRADVNARGWITGFSAQTDWRASANVVMTHIQPRCGRCCAR